MRTESLRLSLAELRAHVLFERRSAFERGALALCLVGVAAGPIASALLRNQAAWMALLLGEAALLFAPVVRGDQPVSRLRDRVAFALVGVLVAVFGEVQLGALAAAALFGVAITPGAPARVRVLAPVALAAGMMWGLAVIHAFDKWSVHALSPLSRAAFSGAVLGLLFGIGALLSHLRWVDPVEGKLAALPGAQRVVELFRRCRASLRRGAAPVVDQLLDTVTLEAGQLSAQLDSATRALDRLDRKEAEAELAKVRGMLEDADVRSRSGLQSAERTWSDALEHMDSLVSSRDRVEAGLLARIAWLERAALGLSTTPRSELGSLAERLAHQRPEPLSLSTRLLAA